MSKQWFSLGKWKSLVSREYTEDDTVTGFFDQIAGYTEEVTYSQGTQWKTGGLPQVAAQDGSTLHGVVAHINLANLTPDAFTIVYERVDGGTYEPLSGDLDVTITRHGRVI